MAELGCGGRQRFFEAGLGLAVPLLMVAAQLRDERVGLAAWLAAALKILRFTFEFGKFSVCLQRVEG